LFQNAPSVSRPDLDGQPSKPVSAIHLPRCAVEDLDAPPKSFAICSPMTEPAAHAFPHPETEILADLRPVMERQLAVLGRLAEAGLNLALEIEQQATADGPAKLGAGEAALAYARVSRAVRLTLALQSKAVAEIRGLDEVLSRYRAGDRQTARAAEAARKARVQRLIERVIGEEIADGDRAERLAEEACERLEHDDIYGDLGRFTPGEIVAQICRDLGLSPDWSRWAGEAWAQEEGGEAGAPFTLLNGTGPPDPRPRPPDVPHNMGVIPESAQRISGTHEHRRQ
jgi:hypothetical protein